MTMYVCMKAGGIDIESSANGLIVNITLPLVPNTATVSMATANHVSRYTGEPFVLTKAGTALIATYLSQHFFPSLRASFPGIESFP